MSFRNHIQENDTKLLKYIWSLKDENKDFDIKWSISKNSSGYSIERQADMLLNKRLDLASKCRHENKYILMNYFGID